MVCGNQASEPCRNALSEPIEGEQTDPSAALHRSPCLLCVIAPSGQK
jgi:hypothetical protein